MNPNYHTALRYQAAWLGVAPERLQGKGFVNATHARAEKIPGYSNPVVAHVLRIEGSDEHYAACAPGLEKKLKLSKMSHHLFFGLTHLTRRLIIQTRAL